MVLRMNEDRTVQGTENAKIAVQNVAENSTYRTVLSNTVTHCTVVHSGVCAVLFRLWTPVHGGKQKEDHVNIGRFLGGGSEIKI